MTDTHGAGRESLHDLKRRLEQAKGPSLELDGRVWCAVGGCGFVQWDGAGLVYRRDDNFGIRHAPASQVRPYTASLDAALALVERVLPGWGYSVMRLPGSPLAAAALQSPGRAVVTGAKPHHALALLLAAVNALIAQENARG